MLAIDCGFNGAVSVTKAGDWCAVKLATLGSGQWPLAVPTLVLL